MRRLIVLFSIIAILLLFTNCTNNQTSNSDYIISLKEAEEILLTEVLQDSVLGGIKIYELTEPLKRYTTIRTCGEYSQYTVTKKSWFFFIDDYFYANWAHPCRYVLINYYRDKGTSYHIINENWLPNFFEDMVEVEFK